MMHERLISGHPRAVVFLQPSGPPTAECLRSWAVASYADIRTVRDELRRSTSQRLRPGAGGFDEWFGYAAVVATELTTNALMHGAPPVAAELLAADSSFVVDVSDGDPSTAPAIAGPRPPGDGGMGLRLVSDLADEVGWYVRGHRKHVWARLAVPGR